MKNLLILLVFAVANLAYADIAGLRISGGAFDYEVSGTIRDSATAGDDTLNLKNDLNIKDDSESQAYIYIEHPIPVLPNIRLGSSSIKLAGTGIITREITYNGTTYSASTNLTTDLDLSHTEVGLYWEIIDTGIDLDIGINFKIFDTVASITDGTTTASTTIDGTIPMLYGALTIPLPGGFSIAGDISTVSYDGSSITDYLIRLRYETDFALGIEAGIRNLTIDYEDTTDQTYADIEVSGPYVSLHLAF